MRRGIKTLICGFTAVSMFAGLATAGPEAVDYTRSLRLPRPPEFAIEEFFDTITNDSPTFSPDEQTMYYVSNASGVFNVWKVPVSGGTPTQVTDADDSILSVTHSPHTDELIYVTDKDGNENFHLYCLPTGGGAARDLTPGRDVRAEFAFWSHDGHHFYYSSNERDPRFMDIYRHDMRTGRAQMVFENPGRDSPAAVSNDGRYLALLRFHNATDMDMYLYDVERQDLKLVSEHTGEIVYWPTSFSPDSQALYYLTDKDSDFLRLARMDLATMKSETVLESDWDVVQGEVSHSGRYLLTATNEDGSTKINVIDQTTGQRLPLPETPSGESSGVALTRSENLMVFGFRGDTQPGDIYVMDMKTREWRRLTRSLKGRLRPEHLVESDLLRYPSFDGLQIPAYLYVPKGRAGRQLLAIIWVHAGSMGQARQGYDSAQQFFLNRGYVILAPNVRGSGGYGKKYHQLDDGDWGGAPLQDVLAGKRFLAALPFVDAEKVIVLGSSYGGYMVLSALTREPGAFAAGVDICGPSNLFTLLASGPPYWEPYLAYFHREVGDPRRDRELLRERSPLFAAHRIRAPLFVIHGANDPRVTRAESDQIVDAVRKNRGIVKYMVFPDEGHELRKKDNRITAFAAVMAFLEKHTKRDEPALKN